MNKFPIVYFQDNLIFNTAGECWAVFKADNFNYEYRTSEQKIEVLNNLTHFITNIGDEAKILIVPYVRDYSKHFEYIASNLNEKDELYKVGKKYNDDIKAYVEDNYKGSVNDYVVYIITKIKPKENAAENVKDFITYLYKEPIQAIHNFFGLDTSEISERKLRSLQKLSHEYMQRQKRRLYIEEASVEDIQWLIQRMFYRGLDDKELRYNSADGSEPWMPYAQRSEEENDARILPYTRDILTLCSGVIDTRERRMLKVCHENNTSYQSFLPLTHIPDSLEFPGCEYIMLTNNMRFPVEVLISVGNMEHKLAIKKLEGKRKAINSQIQHIEKNNEDIPDEILLAKADADSLESELKASRSPLSRISVTFCVYAKDKDTLKDHVRTIRDVYKDNNFVLERPAADQEKLFMEFIPGSGKYTKDFDLLIPPRTLAGGMFGTTNYLGDMKGGYVGTCGNLEQPVYLDLLYACLLNKSASAYCWGDLGYGKSFNMNLLAYLHVMYGGVVFIIDPKGERTKWLQALPEFEGKISVTNFGSSEDDRGKLDPFSIYKNNMDEAGELAINILAEVFKILPKDDEYTCLLEAIETVKKLPKPCMSALVETLENFSESDDYKMTALKFARRINSIRNMGMASLLFGDGTDHHGLNFSNRINIVQVQNLRLPSANVPKDAYTVEETLATVMMMAIGSFAKKFALVDNAIRKLILIDESWSLARTNQGAHLFEFLARTGRSLNTSVIFNGHSVKDIISDGIRNAIRYKFCFHTADRDEAERSLEFLGMEVTDDNIEILSSMERLGLQNGECIFSDAEGRLGRLKFDVVYEHLIQAFKTTPPEKRGVVNG